MQVKRVSASDFDFLLDEKDVLDSADALPLPDDKFLYRIPTSKERDEIIATIIKKVCSGSLPVAGIVDKPRWQKGWQENLDDFIASKFNLEKLTPKFFHPNQPMRYKGGYIIPISPNLELNFYKVFRRWLFRRFLSEFDNIYEFGCGTCFNLVELAQLYPNKQLWGLDWVSPPIEIAGLLARHHGFNIRGRIFDLLEPDNTFRILPGSAVFTIGTLEQLGENFKPFIRYILQQGIGLFLHVNSLIELYDQSNLSDVLATVYDEKRNYLRGYIPYIKTLEVAGKIEILKCQKVSCGGLYDDGYSFNVWRPINQRQERRET